MHALSECLRGEMSERGTRDGSAIRVTVVAPGVVATELPDSIRDEKAKVLRCLRRLEGDEVRRSVVRGQYGRGEMDGVVVPAYREEEGVAVVGEPDHEGLDGSGKRHPESGGGRFGTLSPIVVRVPREGHPEARERLLTEARHGGREPTRPGPRSARARTVFFLGRPVDDGFNDPNGGGIAKW